jgi:hypothetical protein
MTPRVLCPDCDNPACRRGGCQGGPRYVFGASPWWDVDLPCEAPAGGRWTMLRRTVQAVDAAEAVRFAEALLPPGYELDDQARATRVENPHAARLRAVERAAGA